MAEGWRARPFPLLVAGDWGNADPPRPLKNKLLRYFQSRKTSGGGECEMRWQGGLFWVDFAEKEARQRVLSKERHQLDLGEDGVLALVVSLPEETTGGTTEKAPQQVSRGEEQTKEMAEKKPPRTEDVQTVLQKEDITEVRESAEERPSHSENACAESQTYFHVALENIDESIRFEVLSLLIENISGLSVEKDFQTELIKERNAAVITFSQSRDAAKFLQLCAKNARIKEYKITARSLELTQMIKVENIAPEAGKDFITLYFESQKHGGGPVSSVEMLPDEDSAVVTFCNHRVVQRVLEMQHSFYDQPVSVYPYFSSLDTALYGKERPQIRIPEPIRIPLDPYIWQFLQGRHKLVQEIEKEMENCFGDLTWPPVTCEDPEVLICPSAALLKQGRSMRKWVKTWTENVCTEFACIMSKFKSAKCKIIPEAWKTIESKLVKDVLAIPDASKEMVILAGFVFTVDSTENQVKAHIENLTRDAEKARQMVQETLSVAPGKYAILHRILQEENVYKENSGLTFSYDPAARLMQLNGMPAEVYKIKSELLEKLHNMEEKKIITPPVVLQFLQHADRMKVSAAIFHANNIRAFYDLTTDSVALIGYSHDDLLKAEKQMKKDLAYKRIPLEDQQLTTKREWKDLCQRLLKKYNSVDEIVIIDDSLVLEEKAEVTIAGYTTQVGHVYQELSDFVEKNTQIVKVIPLKSVVVVQFMEKEKGNIWHDLKRKGVKIKFEEEAKERNIVLSGPKVEVMKAATVVEEMLSSVHSTKVVFDKPGVKDFFKQREHSYVNEVKTSFGCLILLQKNGASEEKVGSPHAKITLNTGVVVEARKGDLTRFPADVVVNASNEELKHIGGLAEALSRAAGPELQAECNRLIKKHGSLKPGCAVITDAWKLPCKQIVHAVGPRWDSSEKEKCAYLLKKVVKESLKWAETYNHNSIAIPAVSSGIFGFPVKECAHCIVTAVKETLEEYSETGCLKQVYLVDVSEDTVQVFSDALNEVFRGGLPRPESPAQSHPVTQPKETGEDFNVATTSEGLKLILEKKSIQDAMTDVVVSSVGRDLKLGVGPLSKALLQKAGPALQAEFDQAVQGRGPQVGLVIQTRGHNLASRIVLHATVPQWDGGKGQAAKELKCIVKKCLEKTEELSFSSVSFPAIGTGGFSFPRSEVAKLMFEEVLQFSSRKNFKYLQEVHFLLHPKDKDNIQAFSQEFESRTGGNAGFFGPVSTPVLGVHEMQIGPIKFQSMTGDITKENTDVIVNVTNADFNGKLGVSKAILEGGGPQVEAECAALAIMDLIAFHQALQPHKGFITTQGGNLPCKKIIHLAPDSDTRAQVSKVLKECEAKKYTSVAFPAIGTGQAQKSPENAAEDMMSAIADFAGKESPQHLKTVKIIIFQPHLQNAFYTCMKKREGVALPSSESMISKLISTVTRRVEKKRLLVLKKKVEMAVFEICGENRKNVADTESWLKKLILQEQSESHITDELISMFDDAEVEKLNELQKRLRIAIQLEREQSPPFILVSGIPRDILTASTEIQNLIKRLKADQEKKSKAELVTNLVEWQYCAHGDTYKPFDILTNLHLEDARICNKKPISVQINGKSYKVDVKNMCADGQGRSVPIKRIVKDEGTGELPPNWEDMKGSHVKVVLLQPTTQEYQHVETAFRTRCPTQRIEKIERVQNPYLWRLYQVKKKELDKKNGHTNNEKLLFHGTPGSSLSQINHTGFNRSYAGKNAAAIGNGTYFAVHADYSAQDVYSTPDTNGRKFMYFARVLTGDYCRGNQGLITPPAKNTGGFDLYDSVADNMKNPMMFVIFSDAQAYPEYLITFRK
nr:poly [ADP-ribose] polymerase 14-like isoform X1 [Pogona vitticeps]